MNIKQIITDYIRRSILTTQGDLVVRGATIPERLVAVAVGQVFKSGGVGALPAWGVPSIDDLGVIVGQFDRTVAGNFELSGWGFAPKLFICIASDDVSANINLSWGISHDSGEKCINLANDGTTQDLWNNYVLFIRRDGANALTATVSAWGADGLTLNFVLSGATHVYALFLAIG